MQGKQQDVQRAQAEEDRGQQAKTEQQVKQFMSLSVAGQEVGPQVKRPTSSRILAAQARPGASPAKNGSGSPVKLQRIKIMNQTTQGGFKLSIPQPPPAAQAQQQSFQSLQTDYNTQQLLSSQTGSGQLPQPSRQKPPTHGFNSVGGPGTQAVTRMRSPHPEMQAAKQPEFNLTAGTTFAAQSNQSALHPPPSPGQHSQQIQVLATNHRAPKVKIQSSSLNRIQQQSNAHHSTLQSTRNQATASLATVGGASSASGSQLSRPLRAQTNNLITAGATIMANSPHRAEDTPTMPSITQGQQQSQNHRVMYRSTGRGESCERTINNTLDSLAQINKNDATNYQNFQAMQMAIHNGPGGRRLRVAPIAHGLIRSSEKTVKERVSLPMIGQVNATQDSRTGILTKTQSMQYDRSSRVSQDQATAANAVTEPGTRRSSRESKLISRVSSRYTEIGDDENYEGSESDGDSSGGDDEVVTRESRQRSVLEQFLLAEDSYRKGSTSATSPSNGDEAPQGVSLVHQLMQKEKEAAPVWTEQTPKIVGGKVPQLAQDANGTKPKKGQPFDFNFIKILIKRGNSDKDKKEVFLDRHWVQKNNNVPHFANVIKNVDGGEGVEITMNCNKAAFTWLMEFVRIKSNAADHIEQVVQDNGFITKLQKELIEDEMEQHLYVKMEEIDLENCLNILVTAYFLQLFWAYEKVWAFFFKRHFSDVVNACTISLSNINPAIVRHIAERIGEDAMEELQERKDKFISNVYKEKINYHIHMEGGSAASKGTQAPPGLAELEDTERQLLKESKQLYWCARCKNLLTKEQATKISCVEPPALDDAGQPNCALGTDIFEFYKDRVNPLCLAPSDIFKSMLEEEVGRRESQKKKKKQRQQEALENDDGFIDEEGLNLFHHDLVFEEDVPKIVDLMKKHPLEQKRPIKLSVPVDLPAFIKFFREKYRLCWKEIYLKIHALVYRPEQCKKCRKWFQLSQMATCRAGQACDPSDPLNAAFVPVAFHEIDHSEKDVPMQNDLTLHQIQIMKQEVQVLDNQKMIYKVTQRDLEKNKKGKNQIEVLVEELHEQIQFIEPQSMNFDVKISDAYQDFLKRGKGQGKGAADNKVHNMNDILYTNGDRYDYVEDPIDDELYRASKAQKKINKKLKDARFMAKLQKECEHYVRENPDEFKRLEQPSKFKLDIVDNRIVDLEQTKKKPKKEQLDSVQAAEVQQLVIKRFRRCRKDIIMEDDEDAMHGLLRALASVRQNEPREGPRRNASGAGARQRSSNPKGAASSGQPGKNLLLRTRSPQGPAAQSKPEASSNCDFAAQAGVKIYSDIKQITVKKAVSKKVAINTKKQDGPRPNILQRHVARSSGARSGSNQNKAHSNSLAESPMIPVLNPGGGPRNNSSNPKKPGSNSMVLVDDQQDGTAMQTPKHDPNQNPKMRSIQQNNSATRVQVKRSGLSMEGVTLKLPANNFINQSQEQLKPNFDSQQAAPSLNQRRPLRSPGDQQTIKALAASQQSLDRGAAHSGRGPPMYAVAGSAYPPPMKLALPQGLNRSVVEINNPGHTATLSSLKHSQGPSRSGSQGGPTPAESATAPQTLQPPVQPAAATNPAVRITKSPALKIRPSRIDKAQTLLKISQHRQNNYQS